MKPQITIRAYHKASEYVAWIWDAEFLNAMPFGDACEEVEDALDVVYEDMPNIDRISFRIDWHNEGECSWIDYPPRTSDKSILPSSLSIILNAYKDRQ